MIRGLDKIKSKEEYEERKKDLEYYLSEYKWISEAKNPKKDVEQELKVCLESLSNEMEQSEEREALSKIHTLKTKYNSIVSDEYKGALRRNITSLILMIEQFEANNQGVNFGQLLKGVMSGSEEIKDYIRRKYMVTLANMYGTTPAPESLNVEKSSAILEEMAKYDFVEIDLSEVLDKTEEVGLVPVSEPLIGMRGKVYDIANSKTESYMDAYGISNVKANVSDEKKVNDNNAKNVEKNPINMKKNVRTKEEGEINKW